MVPGNLRDSSKSFFAVFSLQHEMPFAFKSDAGNVHYKDFVIHDQDNALVGVWSECSGDDCTQSGTDQVLAPSAVGTARFATVPAPMWLTFVSDQRV